MSVLSVGTQSQSILIVDDTANNLQTLSRYLTDAGYQVFVAQNSAKAIDIAQVIHPELILLDVMMSETNGWETYDLLKNNSQTKDLPVIFITALSSTPSQLKGFELGEVDYITTPINRPELLARIKTHLTIQRLNRQLAIEAKNKQLLWEITDCIRQSLDLNAILQTAVEGIIKVLQCDRLTITHLEHRNVVTEAQSIADRATVKLPERLDFDYCCPVVQEWHDYSLGRVRVIEQVSDINEIRGNIQAQLIAPILLDETTPKATKFYPLWGWLIAEQATCREWKQEEIELLRSLTAQLAIALQQTLLYQQVQQSNQQLHIGNQQLKSINKQLEELALLDPLTKVFNRRYFDRYLDREWNKLKHNLPTCLSLIICDLDCFKIYNDTYGHQQGDRCLQIIAEALTNIVKGPADIVARYGGEEFAIVLPNTLGTDAIKVAEALRIAVKDLNIPHLNSTVNPVVTMSLGVASTIPRADNSPALSIEAAEQALYIAKSRGRDCLAVYKGDVSQSKQSQNNDLYWSRRIRQALEYNLFSLYAQPIVPLDENDRQQRFEILLRLTDLEGNIVSPNAFFGVAARNSLMPDIDTWVVDNVLKAVAESSQNSWQNRHYSINLSGASLNNNSFLKYLTTKLNDYHLPGEIFCFEITETIAIDNFNVVSKFIHSVKNIGCSFALDDFGKGMSSLSYLKNLPIDYLKIDGSFITELHQDRVSKTIVEGIHHIAEGMGLKTVAEFVENQDILDTLRDLKVDYAQGYHLGRPGKLTDILYSG